MARNGDGEEVAGFAEVATLPRDLRNAQLVGAFTTSDIVLCSDNTLFTSFDGGGYWTMTYRGQDEDAMSSEFITPSDGFVIESEVMKGFPAAQWSSRMLMTHDGGQSWTPVAFGD